MLCSMSAYDALRQVRFCFNNANTTTICVYSLCNVCACRAVNKGNLLTYFTYLRRLHAGDATVPRFVTAVQTVVASIDLQIIRAR